jgi:hypothetical protein
MLTIEERDASGVVVSDWERRKSAGEALNLDQPYAEWADEYRAVIAADPDRLATAEDLEKYRGHVFEPLELDHPPTVFTEAELGWFQSQYDLRYLRPYLAAIDKWAMSGTVRTLAAAFIRASDILTRKQRWLWEDRIPLGLPTILAGMQGLGKSTFTAWLAAMVSTGQMDGKARAVIILSTEDDPATTIVPRLQAAGADLDLIRIHNLDRPLAFPRDTAILGAAVKEYRAGVVIVDPIMGYLDDETGQNNTKEVRKVLDAVAYVGRRYRATILALMHFRKESAAEVLHMITSSSAFTEAPRSILGLGREPETRDDEGRLALVHLKCNVGRLQRTILGQVVEAVVDSPDGPLKTGLFVPGDESDLSRDDVFKPVQGRPATVKPHAVAFIAEMQKKYGASIPSTKMNAEWKKAELGSADTLRRALQDSGWVAQENPTNGAWSWVQRPYLALVGDE